MSEPVTTELEGQILVVTLTRPEKRNAISDPVVLALEKVFDAIPREVRAVVLTSLGEHFSAGLDLSELRDRDAFEAVHHSRQWTRIFEKIQFGPVPVVAHLKGAVIGGGIELATATHIRVAERSAYYALPEGQRGIYTGGGASVRLTRVIGVDRMMDMMLTGRTYTAEEGYALGLSQYLVEAGEGLAKSKALAERIAANIGATNFGLVQALPRIAEANRETGFLMESLMASIAQAEPEAKRRLRDFLEGRAAKIKPQG